SGNFIPEPQLLHGLVCDGTPGVFFHFTPWAARVPVPMSEVARLCLDHAGADSAALVMLADTAGLLGAALKRSPAAGDVPAAPLAFPEIRQWLSFTPERAHAGSLALVVGVVARATAAVPAPFLRPLGGAAGSPLAHLHAAAFTFQTLPDGFRPLAPVLSALFATQRLQGLLHLIHDDRLITGGGESLFWRGNVWCGPLAGLEVAP
ncbi:MAG: anti-sigma factor antagonist, partial [Lentisphaeria bacterium]